MVSLYITVLGKLIQGRTAADAYDRLKALGYLADSALLEREAVIQLIRETEDNLRSFPALGAEPWRNIQEALIRQGYLSAKGLRKSMAYRSRGNQWWKGLLHR